MTKSEIRDKQIYLPSIIFEVQAAGINFEKLLGRFNLLQFCPSVTSVFLLCYFNLPLKFLVVIFMFLLI